MYSIPARAALPLRDCGNAFQLDDLAPLPPGITARGIGEGFPTTPQASLAAHAERNPGWLERCGL